MKKTAILLTILLLCILVTPVGAKSKERMGSPLSIWSGYTTYPQGEPFHIAHGFAFDPPDDLPIGLRYFELALDGVVIAEDFIDRGRNGETGMIDRIWVFNFPDGLDGSHEFVGRYIKACRYAVDENNYPGPCSHPNEPIVVSEPVLVVDFY